MYPSWDRMHSARREDYWTCLIRPPPLVGGSTRAFIWPREESRHDRFLTSAPQHASICSMLAIESLAVNIRFLNPSYRPQAYLTITFVLPILWPSRYGCTTGTTSASYALARMSSARCLTPVSVSPPSWGPGPLRRHRIADVRDTRNRRATSRAGRVPTQAHAVPAWPPHWLTDPDQARPHTLRLSLPSVLVRARPLEDHGNVFHRICRSRANDQFSTYRRSSLTDKSQLKLDRPLTCQRPVRPGLTTSRRRT